MNQNKSSKIHIVAFKIYVMVVCIPHELFFKYLLRWFLEVYLLKGVFLSILFKSVFPPSKYVLWQSGKTSPPVSLMNYSVNFHSVAIKTIKVSNTNFRFWKIQIAKLFWKQWLVKKNLCLLVWMLINRQCRNRLRRGLPLWPTRYKLQARSLLIILPPLN